MTRKRKTHACVESERYEDSITVRAVCGQIAWIDDLTNGWPTCLNCRRILAAAKRKEHR